MSGTASGGMWGNLWRGSWSSTPVQVRPAPPRPAPLSLGRRGGGGGGHLVLSPCAALGGGGFSVCRACLAFATEHSAAPGECAKGVPSGGAQPRWHVLGGLCVCAQGTRGPPLGPLRRPVERDGGPGKGENPPTKPRWAEPWTTARSQCSVNHPGHRAEQGSRAPGALAHGNTERQVVEGLRTEVCGQQTHSGDPHNNQHNPRTPTTGRR